MVCGVTFSLELSPAVATVRGARAKQTSTGSVSLGKLSPSTAESLHFRVLEQSLTALLGKPFRARAEVLNLYLRDLSLEQGYKLLGLQ